MKISLRLKERVPGYLPWLIFSAAFFIYLFTLCPTFYWRDSAEFVDAAFALGVAHPAGFPTYLPPANLMTYLPFGPIAFKINLLSALMGAGAAVALYFLTRRLILVLGGDGKGRALFFSATTALAFAFSFSLWESSVSAEVYAGMGVVSALLLLWAIIWAETGDLRYLFAGSFLLGLAAGLHGTAAFFVPALVLFVIFNYKGRLRPADLVLILFFFFVGFSVYIYLPLRSAAGPKIDWGNPHTLEGFLIQILDKKDTAYHFAISRGGFIEKVGGFFYVLFRELTLLWPLTAVYGFYLLVRKNWKLFTLLVLFGAVHIAFFIWYWGIGTIYIPFYVAVMAAGGAGLFFLSRRLSEIAVPKVNAARILAIVTGAMVCFNLVYNFSKLDKSDYYAAEDFTTSDYYDFDYGSMVVTNLLWPNFDCLQDVGRLREDLTIIAVGDIIQPDYFNRFTTERYPGLAIPPGKVSKDTGVAFLRNLIFLNAHYRTVYIGPDEDIVKRLTSRLLPEVLFFRLVTDKEARETSRDYYDAYIHRLDDYTRNETALLGSSFYVDEVFSEYYQIVFNTMSTFFIDRKLWDVEVKVLRYSAIFGSLTSKQMIDTGIALMNMGQFPEAEVALKRVIVAEPTERRAHTQLGRLYILMEQYDKAQKEFETALRLGDAFYAYYGMGMVAYERGNRGEAERLLKKALESADSKTPESEKDGVRSVLWELAGTTETSSPRPIYPADRGR
jgi:tetratricopeptide (TPR) repeat protein